MFIKEKVLRNVKIDATKSCNNTQERIFGEFREHAHGTGGLFANSKKQMRDYERRREKRTTQKRPMATRNRWKDNDFTTQ